MGRGSSRRNLTSAFSPAHGGSSNNRDQSHSTGGFYGRARGGFVVTPERQGPQRVDMWQPGECIPQNRSEPAPGMPDFYSLLVQMKTSITNQIQEVQTSVQTLSDRVNELEHDFSSTSERIRLNETPSSSTSPSESASNRIGQRKRRVSAHLAVSYMYISLIDTYLF